MITVTQMCDGCGEVRELTLREDGDSGERLVFGVTSPQADGWRRVRQNKHLCSVCIDTTLGETTGD